MRLTLPVTWLSLLVGSGGMAADSLNPPNDNFNITLIGQSYEATAHVDNEGLYSIRFQMETYNGSGIYSDFATGQFEATGYGPHSVEFGNIGYLPPGSSRNGRAVLVNWSMGQFGSGFYPVDTNNGCWRGP